ncbi:hypothetical protein MAP00_004035 [Monascus purpureus]|nr:hypothetical protein MAP00_004035 [Monascus purpureus]
MIDQSFPVPRQDWSLFGLVDAEFAVQILHSTLHQDPYFWCLRFVRRVGDAVGSPFTPYGETPSPATRSTRYRGNSCLRLTDHRPLIANISIPTSLPCALSNSRDASMTQPKVQRTVDPVHARGSRTVQGSHSAQGRGTPCKNACLSVFVDCPESLRLITRLITPVVQRFHPLRHVDVYPPPRMR